MKKAIITGFVAGIVLLLVSLGMIYSSIYLFPKLTEEYFSPVFRSNGKTDVLYFIHPFIVSFALKWFWERYKGIFKGSIIVRAIEVSLVYGIVAMLPVLWLTFSAIDVSFQMCLTWFFYGLIQAFVAGLIFAKMNP
jgi:hypothetical protein